MSLSKKKWLIVLFLFIIILGVTAACNINRKPIQISYYYYSPCASCEEDKKFSDLFHKQLDDVLVNKPYQLRAINTFASSNHSMSNKVSLEKMYDIANVPINDRIEPILFIDDSYLSGTLNIEENMRNLFLEKAGIENKITYNRSRVVEDNTTKDLIFNESSKPYFDDNPKADYSHIEYYYTSSCKDCENTLDFFKSLMPSYIIKKGQVQTKLSINYNNILNTDNLNKLKLLFKKYDVPVKNQQVPIVFYGDGYLSGYSQINKNLVSEIEKGKALNYQEIEYHKSNSAFDITIFSIMLAGFINGLNPCSVSMLLYLFSLIVAKNANILKMSSSFILGKSISYFIVGFFIYYSLNLMDSILFKTVNVFISVILILLCLILCVLNLLDFISSKNENYQKIKLQLPSFLRKTNHSIIKKILKNNNSVLLVIGSFVLGFIISIGEFLCTGQIYVATILSLFNQSNNFDLKAAFFLFIYIACMAVPFIIFTVIIYKSRQVLELSEKFRKLMPFVKLINAMLFLLFGIFAIFKLVGGV